MASVFSLGPAHWNLLETPSDTASYNATTITNSTSHHPVLRSVLWLFFSHHIPWSALQFWSPVPFSLPANKKEVIQHHPSDYLLTLQVLYLPLVLSYLLDSWIHLFVNKHIFTACTPHVSVLNSVYLDTNANVIVSSFSVNRFLAPVNASTDLSTSWK